MPTCEVAIVGAGPYGLSACAHLRADSGREVRVFGGTMDFWEQMPKGMLLRSPWEGSHLSDPNRKFTLDTYRMSGDNHLSAPVTLDRFVQYGRWFQQHAVPDVDSRRVKNIDRSSSGFQILLNDGEVWKSRRLVVATGIGSFAHRPTEFSGLPVALASHTSEHADLSRFAGQKILVIGAGQSALESAALLHESGADVEVLVRTPMVRWLWRRPWIHTFKPLGHLLYAPPDVGPAGISHLVARPDLYRRFPRKTQERLAVRSIRPAGAAWLKPRLKDVPITTGRTVVCAVPDRGRLMVKLDDGSDRFVDHALLGTGYRVDISRYGFLDEGLLASIDQINGYPRLDAGFESSVPGLHFIGAPAAWSFGPLMRFVAGTEFTSRKLARRVLGKAAGHFREYQPCYVPDAA